MHFGDRLREVRQRHGLTQEQLARLMGLNQNNIWNMEQTGHISAERLAKVAEVLGESVLVFFDTNSAGRPVKTRQPVNWTLQTKFDALPEPLQASLLQHLDALMQHCAEAEDAGDAVPPRGGRRKVAVV